MTSHDPRIWLPDAWEGRSEIPPVWRAVLGAAARVYGAAVAARNAAYDRGWLQSARIAARVIGVGNLTVGGSGKTPTTLWLAERLRERGAHAAIVARGYRKQRSGTVVVSRGDGPLVTAGEGGDEAVMLAHRFRGPVLTGESRVDAARRACGLFGVDTVVLDDGFQHRALARDADLVLLPPSLERVDLLPLGPWREPLAGLRRARAALVIGADEVPASVRRVVGSLPVFVGRPVVVGSSRFADGVLVSEPLDRIARQPLTVVAGIARPERVADLARASGLDVRGLVTFPDHHPYAEDDVARIRDASAGGCVLTTEKDLVKLGRLRGLPPLWALRLDLQVDDGDRLLDLLLSGG